MRLLLPFLVVLLLADWLQTLTIAANPARWFERNPILGKHPSIARVNVWFVLCGAAAFALLLLPPVSGACVCFAWIVAEAACVVNNHRLGLDEDRF